MRPVEGFGSGLGMGRGVGCLPRLRNTKKLGDSANHRPLFGRRQFRENWQRQCLFSGPLCFGQIAFLPAQRLKTLL